MQPAPHAAHRPIDRNWRRVLATSPALAIPTKRVAELMEFVCALSGPALERAYQEFVARPEGRHLLAERPDLPGTLADRDALAAYPENSLAAAYLAFTGRYRFDAAVFEEIHSLPEMGRRLGWTDDVAWLMARGLQMHDLWHVLTDYGPDYAGEGGNVAFTNAIVQSAGTRALVGIFRVFDGGIGRARMRRFLAEADLRGRLARRKGVLMVAPYEELLGEDIDDVREWLGILPSAVAHPEGIPYSTFRYGLSKDDAPPAERWEPRGGRTLDALGV